MCGSCRQQQACFAPLHGSTQHERIEVRSTRAQSTQQCAAGARTAPLHRSKQHHCPQPQWRGGGLLPGNGGCHAARSAVGSPTPGTHPPPVLCKGGGQAARKHGTGRQCKFATGQGGSAGILWRTDSSWGPSSMNSSTTIFARGVGRRHAGIRHGGGAGCQESSHTGNSKQYLEAPQNHGHSHHLCPRVGEVAPLMCKGSKM